MNLRRFLIFTALLIAAALLWFFWPMPKSAQPVGLPSQKPAEQTHSVDVLPAPKDVHGRLLPVDPNATRESRETDPRSLRKVTDAYLAPILFYGKVVDERGQPIADASVRFEAVDKPFSDASAYTQTSDAAGTFSLEGAHGSSVSLWVSKAGYYSTAESKGRFVYGGIRGGDDPENPTTNKPAVFVLTKMGATEPLVHVPLKTIRVPKNGQPIDISLVKGTTAPKGQGDLVVECWTSNEGLDPNLNQHYAWRSRISIPGGGLHERRGEFEFEAPVEGYTPQFEVEMPAVAEHWRERFEKQFFAKLRDGRFARLKIELTTGGDHFIVLESFLNPIPSHRNLEFDSSKATATPKR